ncbi:PIN domain-containing protein [Desulfonema limicola]|uniref:PIN domain-containing protein n=1 Tax=Desulfonema limicola TaxID=45656 RepID=A0A975GH55_9BACT|nr:type II toxin-antitoxin system VapC family toxin [Desulfonema limicola]QTA80893.1 PIN domain-containing protein [Desulfonema limicola]
MNKRYFFDTSALIKLYHDETGTEDLSNMIDDEYPDIVISDLTTIEIVSAFAKKVRMNEISKDIFEEVMIAFNA